jgi:kumamolisin
MNKAFAVRLNDYSSPRGEYRSHDGPVNLPTALAHIVKAVVGLTNRQVNAQRFSTARRQNPDDPPNTKPLTPQDVAALYNFPSGDGVGQTIGIYEMTTSEGAAGYTTQDLTDTMRSFGGNLTVPKPIDVAIDGVGNSGVSDGETGLDITIASAIAQRAKIAVYFAGGEAQNIFHALQRMIHPDQDDPQPTILSISYGWGPDDPSADSFSSSQYSELSELFQDAANLSITVLVSSGDSGAYIASPTQAQTSYPATDPWVVACGGTTIGDVRGGLFEEYVWNDTGRAGPGATGGGVSARFPVPDYQNKIKLPKRIGTRKSGRGIPDIAGNASENSGYNQFINGKQGPVGGTSAVAPLYAGLIARINANLGRSVGFINPLLYGLPSNTFRDVLGAPGPANNSFACVKGYPAGRGWDACTGFGSVNGTALQDGLNATSKKSTRKSAHVGGPTRVPPAQGNGGARGASAAAPLVINGVFASGDFRGVSADDAFAQAAISQDAIEPPLEKITWPDGLAPASMALGHYQAGTKITGPVQAEADVLVVLYTEPETMALLDVFTGNKDWSPARRAQWCGYAHNFAKYKSGIVIGDDEGLKAGLFGYLSAAKIGGKNVVLYKSELHPKADGDRLAFIPVMRQLISELKPGLVISTGTSGAIGGHMQCGDVTVCNAARFHCLKHYAAFPEIDTMTANHQALTSQVQFNTKYTDYANAELTKLSVPGLERCHASLPNNLSFVKSNNSPTIYVAGKNPVPGQQPMAAVSADYISVDDNHDSEGLQSLGIVNETDDAFLFYAIDTINGSKPKWLSIRNASEPQIQCKAFPPGTSKQTVERDLESMAGTIYGIYQYCTTLNSAFACWGVIAGL